MADVGVLLAALKPKGSSPKEPAGEAPSKPAMEDEESEKGGSEMEFARIASEASAAGDHEAAAEALVSAIKACMSSYGSKE